MIWLIFVVLSQTTGAQGSTPADTTDTTATFQSGQVQEEVVKGKAALRIEDARKPMSIFSIPAREVMDSFLVAKESQLLLSVLYPVESLLVRTYQQPMPYLRRPPDTLLLQEGITLKLPEVRKTEKYQRWRVDIYDALGSRVKSFEGNGVPPRQLYWDGIKEDGTPMIPGEAYSAILVRITPRGKERSQPIGILQVPGIQAQAEEGYRVAMWDSRTVFQERTAVPLPTSFRGPFQEMVNFILENLHEEAEIRVYADPEYLVVDQVNYLENYFQKMLPYSTQHWKVTPSFFHPGEFRIPRIEIWVR